VATQTGDPPLTDPLQWRPQVALPTRRPSPVTDPIVEPIWSGWRVLAHFDAARPEATQLIDVFGDDVASTEPEVVAELAGAVLAIDAVIDGILTQQATRSGEGIAVLHDAHLNPTNVLMSREPRVDVERRAAAEQSPVALVCLDLLRVDGQSLLDLPLLERKRLLEGVIGASELVRISPFTRPPVEQWVASWKAAGFKGAMLKAANSRYTPGRQSPDWVPVTRLRPGR
jgi:bifunctional non-homologous end joining protein LigD